MGVLVQRLGLSVYECGLDCLKVPGAIVVPEQLVDCHKGIGDAELAVMVFGKVHGVRELGSEPFYGFCSSGSLFCRRIHAESLYKAVAVPYLVAECGALLNLGLIVEDIVTCA